LAVKGTTEFAQTLGSDFDYLCCAVGTGGTLAGLIQGLSSEKTIFGFPVLKGGEFLKEEIESLLLDKTDNWKLISDYHFGGYAKVTNELKAFINAFQLAHQINIEPIYTAKMFFGLFDLIDKGYFPKGSIIFVLHSGGLQLYK
jgi:1-aminocyclopropane-1-carboxylate deaminase/D-cysteine desulfhydrase-like pyridoxal-dependent ACC family enzyme